MSMQSVAHGEAPRYAEPLAPPWDIGRPQRAVYELDEAGAIGRSVLDVGCGAGEHALFLASRGHVVVGVDPSARAVARASAAGARARRCRHLRRPRSCTRLDRLGRSVRPALDAGSFHRVPLDARAEYARSLAAVVRPGGQLFVLCFGDHELGHGGPRRVTRAELCTVLEGAGLFRVDEIVPGLIESRVYPGGANAWLAKATRR